MSDKQLRLMGAAAWNHSSASALTALYGSTYAIGPLILVGFPCKMGLEFTWCNSLPKSGYDLASAPNLTGTTYGPGHQFQFLLNGPTGTSFTVQFSTTLGAAFWNTLLVTNSLTSPITILDPNASGRPLLPRPVGTLSGRLTPPTHKGV